MWAGSLMDKGPSLSVAEGNNSIRCFHAPLPLSIGLLVLVLYWRCWRNPSALTHAKVASRAPACQQESMSVEVLVPCWPHKTSLRGNFNRRVLSSTRLGLEFKVPRLPGARPSEAEGTQCLSVRGSQSLRVTQGCYPMVFLSEWGE